MQTYETKPPWLSERIWNSVHKQTKPQKDDHPKTRIVKFRKVYKGPGFPIDPRLEEARMLDGFVNLVPQPPRTYDASALINWIRDSAN